MKRALAVAGIVALLSSSFALAHQCFVASKPVGAGSAGDSTLELTTGEYDASGVNFNEAGKPTGGFESIDATINGDTVAEADVFTHKTLPEGARNSGPGDDACDGVGIDDAEACFSSP